MLRTFVSCLGLSLAALATMASCSSTDDSPTPPEAGGWGPGKAYASPEGVDARGFLDLRGIIHAHSIYSHDACDGEPFDADGNPNQTCFDDLRRGICQVKHDFVMLTDHGSMFSDYEYPDVLLYRDDLGDELVMRNGEPAANRAGCPDGTSAMIMAGTETGTMPVGLERHVSADLAERDAVYGDVSPEAIGQFKAAGAVSLVAHTEDWTVEQLTTLPLDGFEMFNLHANMYLAIGEAMGLLAKQNTPELLPHPDLAVLPLIREDSVYLDLWDKVLASGAHRVTTMATDAHRNTFKQLLPDGERTDSFRRMMLAFSNHLLVKPDANGAWDDTNLKEALRAERLYGVFEYLGYAEGFDYHAEQGAEVREMGQDASIASHAELRVARPHVRDLDPSVTPPEIRVRLLRATGSGWEEAAAASGDVAFQPTVPGAYRAEVRIIPHHLEGYLSSYADLAANEFVWVYSNAIYVGD